MAYILKQSKLARGLYLQIYETTYDKETKKSNNKCYETWGYYDDLKEEYEDPIAAIKQKIYQLNSGNIARDIGADIELISSDRIYNFGCISGIQLLNSNKIRSKWKRELDEDMYDLLLRSYLTYRFRYEQLIFHKSLSLKEKKLLRNYVEENIETIISLTGKTGKWYCNFINYDFQAVFNKDFELLYYKKIAESEKEKLVLIRYSRDFELMRNNYFICKALFITEEREEIVSFLRENNIKKFIKLNINKKPHIIFLNEKVNLEEIKKIDQSFIRNAKPGGVDRNIECAYRIFDNIIYEKRPEINLYSHINCIKISKNNYINITNLHDIPFRIVNKDFLQLQYTDNDFKKMLNDKYVALIAPENFK